MEALLEFEGTWKDDTLIGGGEDDYILGHRGDDYLYGGTGTDIVYGGGGSDAIFGGGGGYIESNNNGQFGHYEQLYGGNGNDYLYCTGGGLALIFGGNGADHFFGGSGGWMSLNGGNGNDYINVGSYISERQNIIGGAGIDLADFSNLDVGYQFSLGEIGFLHFPNYYRMSLYSIENLIGTRGNDLVVAAINSEEIRGGLGNDTIWGDLSDHISVFGGEGNDELLGSRDCFLYGGAGRDRIMADGIFAIAGSTASLFGGAGRDTLVGGVGDDFMTGGAGVDVFQFYGAAGHDTILDFLANHQADKIDLTGVLEILNFNDLLTEHLSDGEAGVVISFGESSIVLLGVHSDDLTAANFILG